MRFQMCVWEQGHICVQLFQVLTELKTLSHNAIYSKCYNFWVACESWWQFCFMKCNTIFVMVIILFSSDSGSLSPVICWNIVVTTLHMSFTDKLFALGTDWLRTCWLCLRGGTYFSYCGGAGLCNWGWLRLLPLLYSTVMKDSPGLAWLEQNTVPVLVLGTFCKFLFHISTLACLQPQ
jgi:hypothetical protein